MSSCFQCKTTWEVCTTFEKNWVADKYPLSKMPMQTPSMHLGSSRENKNEKQKKKVPICHGFSQHFWTLTGTPLKTNGCPLKINGWKMYSLFKIVPFWGHVRFQGCTTSRTCWVAGRIIVRRHILIIAASRARRQRLDQV